MNATLVVGTIIGGGDTQTFSIKKIEFYALSDSGYAKTSGTNPHGWALALVPITSPHAHYEPPGETFTT